MSMWMVVIAAGCREFHEQPPFEECQPYELTCPACTFTADRDDDDGRTRVWGCTDTERSFDAVTRRSANVPAYDTRFYDVQTGLRIASVRLHDGPVEICGEMLTDEWYGEVLDCSPVCEHEPTFDGADPALGVCDAITWFE
ncbi:MAG: hypothetical protein KTR31_06515 [Myxococcales bacterium]|nr:hypothetical protein [Myxococcales bacterium]